MERWLEMTTAGVPSVEPGSSCGQQTSVLPSPAPALTVPWWAESDPADRTGNISLTFFKLFPLSVFLDSTASSVTSTFARVVFTGRESSHHRNIFDLNIKLLH